MIKTRCKPSFLLILLLLLITSSLSAQTNINSPYSRFGIGDLSGNSSAWNLSMGGTGIALRSNYHIGILNPASYTAFDSTSFIFEGGVIYNYVTLKTDQESASRSYASLGYLNFGFPVTKWWKTTLCLLPYSNVGYNVSNSVVMPGIGLVSRVYSGSGGINRFMWGNGFKLTKNVSIGVNASYLFGSLVREAQSTFPDSSFYLNTRVDNNITVSGLYFDYGIQYTAKLKKGLRMTVGGILGLSSKVTAKTDNFTISYASIGGSEYVKDTIASAPGVHGSITIPLMFGLGLSLEKPDKWLVSADYRWQDWKDYRAFGLNDSLVNGYRINAGVEYLPDIENYTNYFKRIRYRLGLRYNSTYLELRQKHLNEYGISVGLGLPIRGMKTAINLSAEFGTRGTTQSSLIKETYFNFVLGFSIYERWFVKRKYF